MKGYHDSKTTESMRDQWRTPKHFFDYYDRRFEFDCDVACSSKNCLCQSGFMFDEGMDALANCGFWGNKNWCNPPYSDISPWVDHALVEMQTGSLTVMLLPADTSVKWFKLAFEHCTECHFISGRLAFINEETGKPVSGNNKGSVVFVFDPHSPIKHAVSLIDRDEIMKGKE